MTLSPFHPSRPSAAAIGFAWLLALFHPLGTAQAYSGVLGDSGVFEEVPVPELDGYQDESGLDAGYQDPGEASAWGGGLDGDRWSQALVQAGGSSRESREQATRSAVQDVQLIQDGIGVAQNGFWTQLATKLSPLYFDRYAAPMAAVGQVPKTFEQVGAAMNWPRGGGQGDPWTVDRQSVLLGGSGTMKVYPNGKEFSVDEPDSGWFDMVTERTGDGSYQQFLRNEKGTTYRLEYRYPRVAPSIFGGGFGRFLGLAGYQWVKQ
jgi:hypothetical protein